MIIYYLNILILWFLEILHKTAFSFANTDNILSVFAFILATENYDLSIDREELR